MYAIEDNVPLPPLTKGHPPKYPFRDLLVGQSFFVPQGDRKTLAVLASRNGKSLNATFTVRQIDGGIRVWRVK